MKVNEYVDSIESFGISNRKILCIYCGARTYSRRHITICSNCELPNLSLHKNTQNNELIQWLTQYNEFIEDENYPAAINTFDQIIGIYKTHEYLYVQGINYIKYSNFIVNMIRYDRDGFMEENAAYKKASNEIYYNARLFLYKSINAIEMHLNSDDSNISDILYARLLTQIKLGDMRGASDSIERMLFSGNKYLKHYSDILFYDAINNSQKSIESIDTMIEQHNDYPINIFYYLAKSLYEKRQYKKSNIIIKTLSKFVYNRSIEHLSKDVDRFINV